MFGVYSDLTDRLVEEILGPTKNNAELAKKAIEKHDELIRLNEEMVCHNRSLPLEETLEEDEMEESNEDDEKDLEGELISSSVEELLNCALLSRKQRKRGLGKKGRFLAERRYVASRANKLRVAYRRSEKNGTSADCKWMAARLRRSYRFDYDLCATFAEMIPVNPQKIEYVPPTTEENLVCWEER